MASNFPTSLDAFTNPNPEDNQDSATVPHASQHANANDAIENLEAKVGIDGSAVATSLDFLVKDTTGGHNHDGANSRAIAAGAPTGADYLVGTAQAGLSAEIVVGATPGGELGGTWGSPTVDATHSGSSHAATQAAAEAASIPKTIGDEKGQLIGFSADNTPVIVPKASADGKVLKSLASGTGGFEWASEAGGVTSLWVPASSFVPTSGTPSSSFISVVPVYLLDAAATEEISATALIPSGWSTASIKVWVANISGGGAGNVVYDFWYKMLSDGATTNSGFTQVKNDYVVAAPAAVTIDDDVDITTSTSVTAGAPIILELARVGGHASDTLGNDIGVVGVLLEKVT